MGGWWSYVWWGGNPDIVNPTSGLTRREVYAVQKSWEPVFADCVVNGSEIFRRLFTTYPQTKEYFKMVRNLSDEEYLPSPQFKAHVINLMSSLNQAIINLNEPDVVVVMMNKLGESHAKRKIKEQDFNDLKKVLVKIFTEELKLNNPTLTAWDKTVDFLYKHLFHTLSDQAQTRQQTGGNTI